MLCAGWSNWSNLSGQIHEKSSNGPWRAYLGNEGAVCSRPCPTLASGRQRRRYITRVSSGFGPDTLYPCCYACQVVKGSFIDRADCIAPLNEADL
jgi:hypothetical protein